VTYAEIRAAVFAAAEESEPPTWLMLRQAEIESGFNPAAVSDLPEDAAIGVFQVRPKDGANFGFGVPAMSAADLLDPTKATIWAGKALAGLRSHLGGGWGAAFLRYNVGAGGNLHTASAQYKALAQAAVLAYGEVNPLG
jgi:soluble lytic murein transglycosylase-like protein